MVSRYLWLASFLFKKASLLLVELVYIEVWAGFELLRKEGIRVLANFLNTTGMYTVFIQEIYKLSVLNFNSFNLLLTRQLLLDPLDTDVLI